jgi:hypothetical protein
VVDCFASADTFLRHTRLSGGFWISVTTRTAWYWVPRRRASSPSNSPLFSSRAPRCLASSDKLCVVNFGRGDASISDAVSSRWLTVSQRWNRWLCVGCLLQDSVIFLSVLAPLFVNSFRLVPDLVAPFPSPLLSRALQFCSGLSRRVSAKRLSVAGRRRDCADCGWANAS